MLPLKTNIRTNIFDESDQDQQSSVPGDFCSSCKGGIGVQGRQLDSARRQVVV